MRSQRLITLGMSAIALATLAACAPDGLLFRIDERVTITAPEDRAVVTLPLTIRWTAEDLGRRDFAVYIDRAPVAPGERFRPSPRDSFRTTATELTVETLPPSTDDERHSATIVLLDEQGRRVGESAFQVTFEVRDDES